MCLFESHEKIHKTKLEIDHQIRLERNRIIHYSIFPRHKLLYSLKSEALLVSSKYIKENEWKYIFKDDFYKYHVTLNTESSKANVEEFERRCFRKDKFIQEYDLNILDPNDDRVFIGRVTPFTPVSI